MILFDRDILYAIEQQRIVIDPFDRLQLQSNSYDIRLGKTLTVYDQAVLDMKQDNPTEDIEIPDGGLILEPGKLYLGAPREWVDTRSPIIPHIEGRSSVARLGVSVHLSAGFGDVGFAGKWTLEITVVHPIRVYAGVRIAQVFFVRGFSTPLRTYSGKYAGENRAISSRIHLDKDF